MVDTRSTATGVKGTALLCQRNEIHTANVCVSEIVRGRRGITADTALRLGRWMGTGPEYWLRLQELYDLRVAEREHGAEIAKVKPWQDAAA